MHTRRLAGIFAASCLASLPAWAQEVIASASSPGNILSVDVQLSTHP